MLFLVGEIAAPLLSMVRSSLEKSLLFGSISSHPPWPHGQAMRSAQERCKEEQEKLAEGRLQVHLVQAQVRFVFFVKIPFVEPKDQSETLRPWFTPWQINIDPALKITIF